MTESPSNSEKPSVKRRSVLQSVGAVVGASAIAHRASGVTQSGTTVDLSTLPVAEVRVQYELDNDNITPLQVDQFTMYGVDQRNDTLGVINPGEATERTLRSGNPVVIGDGFTELPTTINNGQISELPLLTDGLVSNQYLPTKSPTTTPGIRVRSGQRGSVQITARGRSAIVEVGEEVVLGLDPKGVETTVNDRFRVTPQVRVVNYGELTARKVTE